MTSFKEHRGYPREGCRINLGLECYPCKGSGPFKATAHNISEDGMYIETEYKLKIDDNILISDAAPPRKGMADTVFNKKVGIVRWSKPLYGDLRSLYGAGIKLF